MAGIEDKLGSKEWVSDDNDGLIPRSIRYLWQKMTERQEQFYVKVYKSFKCKGCFYGNLQ